MTKQELKKAKGLLYQYEMMRIKQFEALPDVEFHPTEAYLNKKEELRSKLKSNTLRRRMLSTRQKIGILVAATILTALLATAFAFGTKSKGFFINFFGTCATLDYSEDDSVVKKEYKLTWVPVGYVETNKTTTNFCTQIIYSCDKTLIRFKRYPASYFNKSIDIQNSEFKLFYLNEKDLYYNIKNNEYVVHWINNEFTFSISCTTDIPWSDIEKMILSVKCVE